MKQLLFLLLFPCLAVAQYTGNGNQKITLGEQTTADGLVFRGLAADTTRKPSVDTMAFILLDTNTNIIWQYKKATNNAWTRLNLTQADTSSFNYVNTYGTQTINGAKTFTSAVTATTFNPTALDSSTNKMYLAATNTLGFSTNGRERVRISETGSLLIGAKTDRLYTKLNVIGGATFQTNDFTSLFFNNTDSRGWGINMAFQDNNTDFGYVGSVGSLLGSTTKDMTVWSTAGNGFRVYTNGNNERMRITSGGEAWIGYTTDNGAYALQVKDSVYVGGNVSASAYTTRSDYDLKDEIQNISYGLNEVMQMQPVKYTYKSNGSTQLGFIAQDLGVITPEVVSFEDKMSVYYNALIPILTKAIQEQQILIKALEQRILTLENK